SAPMQTLVAPGAPLYQPQPAEDREQYAALTANPVFRAVETPVSTFSVDVDTGSYSNVRRLLNEGRLPPADAVRVEELINYFDYAYAGPKDRSTPFTLHTELGPTPWNSNTELLAIGIQGWKPAASETRPSNLVFLVDVSGSMHDKDKLPLVKSSLKLLANELTARDRISLVVYAGRTEVVLEPTPGDQTAKIIAALDRLEAGGSTNGASGIQLAYQMAKQAYMPDGNNRVLLATDGDFNVGISDVRQLKQMVEEQRKSGVALSTLGFGTGNYNDQLMEQIADVGNGHYQYIDSLTEARRVFVDERASALETIARDVKIQIEFNPALVAEYRLIGYENRLLKREDFNNDAIDAGDIGAGHRVTALYEIARVGSGGEKIDGLRYGTEQRKQVTSKTGELAFLRLRYKQPDEGINASSRLIERVIRPEDAVTALKTSPSFKLAAAVAAYGQILRGGEYVDRYELRDAAALARSAIAGQADQASGRSAEFVELVKLAASLKSTTAANRPNGETTD
ncbi:VWA domain-containing protein, partial [uncultured Nevskia sp.]|uniref:vWA domain-containing protein n=1 Tax=uncultured Nevskia sp. TaxID=228950 RepID=UPI0025F282E3